jgi:hypothetical protein
VQPMKRGVETSEFWGKTLLQLVSVGFAFYVAQNPGQLTADQQNTIMVVAGLVVPPVLEASYGFYRTWLKRAHALGPQTVVRTERKA